MLYQLSYLASDEPLVEPKQTGEYNMQPWLARPVWPSRYQGTAAREPSLYRVGCVVIASPTVRVPDPSIESSRVITQQFRH